MPRPEKEKFYVADPPLPDLTDDVVSAQEMTGAVPVLPPEETGAERSQMLPGERFPLDEQTQL